MEAAENKLDKDARNTKMVNHVERITRAMSRGRSTMNRQSAMDMVSSRFSMSPSRNSRSSRWSSADLPEDHPIARWQKAGLAVIRGIQLGVPVGDVPLANLASGKGGNGGHLDVTTFLHPAKDQLLVGDLKQNATKAARSAARCLSGLIRAVRESMQVALSNQVSSWLAADMPEGSTPLAHASALAEVVGRLNQAASQVFGAQRVLAGIAFLAGGRALPEPATSVHHPNDPDEWNQLVKNTQSATAMTIAAIRSMDRVVSHLPEEANAIDLADGPHTSGPHTGLILQLGAAASTTVSALQSLLSFSVAAGADAQYAPWLELLTDRTSKTSEPSDSDISSAQVVGDRRLDANNPPPSNLLEVITKGGGFNDLASAIAKPVKLAMMGQEDRRPSCHECSPQSAGSSPHTQSSARGQPSSARSQQSPRSSPDGEDVPPTSTASKEAPVSVRRLSRGGQGILAVGSEGEAAASASTQRAPVERLSIERASTHRSTKTKRASFELPTPSALPPYASSPAPSAQTDPGPRRQPTLRVEGNESAGSTPPWERARTSVRRASFDNECGGLRWGGSALQIEQPPVVQFDGGAGALGESPWAAALGGARLSQRSSPVDSSPQLALAMIDAKLSQRVSTADATLDDWPDVAEGQAEPAWFSFGGMEDEQDQESARQEPSGSLDWPDLEPGPSPSASGCRGLNLGFRSRSKPPPKQ